MSVEKESNVDAAKKVTFNENPNVQVNQGEAAKDRDSMMSDWESFDSELDFDAIGNVMHKGPAVEKKFITKEDHKLYSNSKRCYQVLLVFSVVAIQGAFPYLFACIINICLNETDAKKDESLEWHITWYFFYISVGFSILGLLILPFALKGQKKARRGLSAELPGQKVQDKKGKTRPPTRPISNIASRNGSMIFKPEGVIDGRASDNVEEKNGETGMMSSEKQNPNNLIDIEKTDDKNFE